MKAPAADLPAPARVQFVGYQKLAGSYLFQVRFLGVADNQQPPLKKIGDPLGLGGYVIRGFQLNDGVIKVGSAIPQDNSILQISRPGDNHAIAVPFRRVVELPK